MIIKKEYKCVSQYLLHVSSSNTLASEGIFEIRAVGSFLRNHFLSTFSLMTTENKQFRSGYVALIGEPNVGKSTLLNALLEQKLSIVTNKPQTTRHKILGIISSEGHQIIFLDTPGIIKPKYLLQEMMMHFASSAVEDADIVLLIIDALKAKRKEYDSGKATDDPIGKIKAANKTTFLIINKIDLLKKEEVLPMLVELRVIFPFDEIIPVSALKSFNTKELIDTIVKYLPDHEPYYDTEIVSNA